MTIEFNTQQEAATANPLEIQKEDIAKLQEQGRNRNVFEKMQIITNRTMTIAGQTSPPLTAKERQTIAMVMGAAQDFFEKQANRKLTLVQRLFPTRAKHKKEEATKMLEAMGRLGKPTIEEVPQQPEATAKTEKTTSSKISKSAIEEVEAKATAAAKLAHTKKNDPLMAELKQNEKFKDGKKRAKQNSTTSKSTKARPPLPSTPTQHTAMPQIKMPTAKELAQIRLKKPTKSTTTVSDADPTPRSSARTKKEEEAR